MDFVAGADCRFAGLRFDVVRGAAVDLLASGEGDGGLLAPSQCANISRNLPGSIGLVK